MLKDKDCFTIGDRTYMYLAPKGKKTAGNAPPPATSEGIGGGLFSMARRAFGASSWQNKGSIDRAVHHRGASSRSSSRSSSRNGAHSSTPSSTTTWETRNSPYGDVESTGSAAASASAPTSKDTTVDAAEAPAFPSDVANESFDALLFEANEDQQSWLTPEPENDGGDGDGDGDGNFMFYTPEPDFGTPGAGTPSLALTATTFAIAAATVAADKVTSAMSASSAAAVTAAVPAAVLSSKHPLATTNTTAGVAQDYVSVVTPSSVVTTAENNSSNSSASVCTGGDFTPRKVSPGSRIPAPSPSSDAVVKMAISPIAAFRISGSESPSKLPLLQQRRQDFAAGPNPTAMQPLDENEATRGSTAPHNSLVMGLHVPIKFERKPGDGITETAAGTPMLSSTRQWLEGSAAKRRWTPPRRRLPLSLSATKRRRMRKGPKTPLKAIQNAANLLDLLNKLVDSKEMAKGKGKQISSAAAKASAALVQTSKVRAAAAIKSRSASTSSNSSATSSTSTSTYTCTDPVISVNTFIQTDAVIKADTASAEKELEEAHTKAAAVAKAFEQANDAANQELSTARDDMAAASAALLKAASDRLALEGERFQMREKLTQLSGVHSSLVSEHAKAQATLSETQKSLAEALGDLQVAHERNSSADVDTADNANIVAELEHQLDAAATKNARAVAELEQQLDAAFASATSLATRLNESETRATKLENKTIKMQTKLMHSEMEANKITDEAATRASEAVEMRQQWTHFEVLSNKFQAELAREKQAREAAQQSVGTNQQAFVQACKDAAASVAQLEEAKVQIERLQKELAKASLEASSSLKVERDEAEAALAVALAAAAETHKQELAAAWTAADAAEAGASTQIKQVAAECEMHKAAATNTAKALAEARSRLSSAELSVVAANAELKATREGRDKLRVDLTVAAEKSATATANALFAEVSAAANLSAANDALEASCTKLADTSAALSALETTFAARAEENTKLAAANASIQSALGSTSEQLQQSCADLAANKAGFEQAQVSHNIHVGELETRITISRKETAAMELKLKENEEHVVHLKEDADLERKIHSDAMDSLQQVSSAALAAKEEEHASELDSANEAAAFILQEQQDEAAFVQQKLNGKINGLVATIKPMAEAMQLLSANYQELRAQTLELGVSIKPAIEQAKRTISSAVVGTNVRYQEMRNKYRTEMVLRKKLHNEVVDLRGNIRVYGRLRPVIEEDGGGKASEMACRRDATENNLLIVDQTTAKGVKEVKFDFDRVFSPQSTQAEVFEDVRELVISTVDGYNVCIFAYGQTGSGKTFTMEGTDANPGLNRRALGALFEVCDERVADWDFELQVAVMEIYNERLRDLLSGSTESADLQIKHGRDHRLVIPGLTHRVVENADDVQEAFAEAKTIRATASTQMNNQSSRSHCLLVVTVRGTNKETGQQTIGKLNLIDLAGSERVGKSGALEDATRLKEATNINKSLASDDSPPNHFVDR